MIVREAPPHASWTEAQWVAFRAQQVEACERWPGEWVEHVGRGLVHMADVNLARLRLSASADCLPALG